MLRFNGVTHLYLLDTKTISIHPMLRFNERKGKNSDLKVVFQYILCYGSTIPFPADFPNNPLFQYILCYGSTSIPPTISAAVTKFQYILCYGSTIAVHMIYAFHYTGITLKHQQFL